MAHVAVGAARALEAVRFASPYPPLWRRSPGRGGLSHPVHETIGRARALTRPIVREDGGFRRGAVRWGGAAPRARACARPRSSDRLARGSAQPSEGQLDPY